MDLDLTRFPESFSFNTSASFIKAEVPPPTLVSGRLESQLDGTGQRQTPKVFH